LNESRATIELWQRLASPIWTDINPSDTLQFRSARQEEDERHIAPLQLEVIRRGCLLWSNPGDVVLSPFTGIGSEGWVACGGTTMKKAKLPPRRFIGIELKQSYYEQAVANLQELKRVSGPTLADLFGVNK
jgi:DNA modification methylase